MDLSQSQVETFHREGFLAIENAFAPSEIAALETALPEITESARAKIGHDPASGMLRLSHGAHLYNETYRRLALHPRLVRPAQQLLDTEVHIYQSRLTIKPGLAAVQASGWAWHQDFSTWHVRDGLPEPNAVVTFIFLDDVTAANSPVLVIPRSHKDGLIGKASDGIAEQGGYQLMIIKPDTLKELAAKTGVEALTGPRGTLVFIHCALVHGSAENISPLRRALFSVIFNAVANRARHPRDEHWATADVVPIQPLTDDCLLNLA